MCQGSTRWASDVSTSPHYATSKPKCKLQLCKIRSGGKLASIEILEIREATGITAVERNLEPQ